MAALGGTDIRKVMKSQGPIVTAVILRCPPSSPALDEDEDEDEDSKPAAVVDSKAEPAPENSGSSETGTENETENGDTTDASAPTPRVILSDLIEELQIDTTPSKSKVAEVLGGPFTFLGQFEDEGIVLMVRNFPDDLESDLRDIYENSEEEHHENENENNNNASSFSFSEQLSKNFNIKALKAVCFQRDIDTGAMTEKRELVEALVDYQKRLPPHNPHQLQPPLHKARVRGDIVVMKVAETAEELDHDSSETDNQKTHADDGESKTSDSNDTGGDAGEQKENPSQSNTSDAPNNNNNNNNDDNAKEAITMPSNDEFFLDYSKEAYIEFASRTDIPEHEIELEECDEEHGEETETETETGESGEESAAMVGVDEGDNNDDDDDDDDDDEDDEDDDPEEIDENDKSAMFNLVMNELLRQYREENGRGPNTKELLELRSNIARELGVAIAHEIDGDWDKMAKENQVPSAKKIYFTKEADRVREYVPDANEYPSDRGEEDDEDYDEDEDEDDDEEYSEDVSRPLHDAYDEAEDGEHTDQPPRKRLKVSEDETDEGDSKPPASAAAAAAAAST